MSAALKRDSTRKGPLEYHGATYNRPGNPPPARSSGLFNTVFVAGIILFGAFTLIVAWLRHCAGIFECGQIPVNISAASLGAIEQHLGAVAEIAGRQQDLGETILQGSNSSIYMHLPDTDPRLIFWKTDPRRQKIMKEADELLCKVDTDTMVLYLELQESAGILEAILNVISLTAQLAVESARADRTGDFVQRFGLLHVRWLTNVRISINLMLRHVSQPALASRLQKAIKMAVDAGLYIGRPGTLDADISPDTGLPTPNFEDRLRQTLGNGWKDFDERSGTWKRVQAMEEAFATVQESRATVTELDRLVKEITWQIGRPSWQLQRFWYKHPAPADEEKTSTDDLTQEDWVKLSERLQGLVAYPLDPSDVDFSQLGAVFSALEVRIAFFSQASGWKYSSSHLMCEKSLDKDEL